MYGIGMLELEEQRCRGMRERHKEDMTRHIEFSSAYTARELRTTQPPRAHHYNIFGTWRRLLNFQQAQTDL